ncbi:MAG TPA: hypothetical protein VME20_05955 [Acidimicrobiales bacterium]|nr:hypothetical protein [Acidimicrobiales bacterium]
MTSQGAKLSGPHASPGSRAAFPRRGREDAPTAEELLRQDPRRLAFVIFEAARFGGDLKAVVEGVLILADSLGIEEATADAVVADAVREIRARGNRAG